ncbi:hypothetical protein [Candidatus Palauibacter sp.]|uniref:hypothetical protein n=1 Tax=Candidatus Palauibacter sp. TaxID=3101350 RepID=UPI003B5A3D69
MRYGILLLGALAIPAGAVAQEVERDIPKRYEVPRGMVLDVDAGEWKNPTPETAFAAFQEDPLVGEYAVIAVLRQTFEPWSREELDAFADVLVQSARDGSPLMAVRSFTALGHSAAVYDGMQDTPYAGATDAFIKLFESSEDRASMENMEGRHALFGVYHSGEAGVEYVEALMESSPEPPPCQHSMMARDENGRVIREVDGTTVWTIPENPCPNETVWCLAAELVIDKGGPATFLRDHPKFELWQERCPYRYARF